MLRKRPHVQSIDLNILKMKELSKEDYKKGRAIIRKEEQSICTKSAYNTCAYVSKREQKRRLQKLWHKNAEEQMQEYYLQQEKQAFTIGTPIERNAFEIGKGKRMQKRIHNTLYKEQAGTCGTYVRTMRFENSYITKVCKSRNLY